MTTYSDTWLIIPVYNEGEILGEVLQEAQQVFPSILCIDDASTDNSREVALRAGVTVIPHPINLGQGAALQTGFDYICQSTDARYVITFDADGQHRIDDAIAMRRRSEAEDLAFIFGSRFLRGVPDTGIAKRWLLRFAAQVTRLRSGLRVSDAHNGLRLIRRDALSGIRLRQSRMAHASEIVEQLAATGLKWSEHPVDIRYTEYSKKKGQPLINSVNIVVDLLMK